MANKKISLKEIVEHFQKKWFLTNDNPNKRGFWFGYPQEIDDRHEKRYPFMFVLPPEMKFKLNDLQKDTYLAYSKFTVLIYDFLPSEYKIKNESAEPASQYNDGMKYVNDWTFIFTLAQIWWADCWNRKHTDTVTKNLTPEWWNDYQTDFTEPLNIELLSDATNDRTLGVKLTFGISHYRFCIED